MSKKQLSLSHSNILGAEDDATRLVVVRYYLDRPGMDLQHSSARLWKDPPSLCSGLEVADFLKQQGIVSDQVHLLVEIYLQDFMSFMLLEACEEDGVRFDFSRTNPKEPGILNIRLTDVAVDWTGNEHPHHQQSHAQPLHQNCNTSPPGLFAFALNVAMEATSLLGKLVPGTVNESFVLLWGPYTFFVSGLLMLITGMFSVTRNNVYGATAFMTFGSFGLSNGLRLILLNYFPDAIPPSYSASDPVGSFIRNIFIFGFCCILLKQTFQLKRFTTLMIVLLCVTTFARSIAGWSVGFQWIQMIFGFSTSFVAFYVFAAEFTNEVYHREVLKLYPWHKQSPEEAFGAAGRVNKLQSTVLSLRSAHSDITPSRSVGEIRSVRPSVERNT